MTSCVNTSPLSKNSWSFFKAVRASSKEPQAEGTLESSSGLKPYMSLSRGLPGSILFFMPSSPAKSMAAKARYPLQLGSGKRTSMRFALGDGEYMGMRMEAERLRLEYARLIGASKPGTSLL